MKRILFLAVVAATAIALFAMSAPAFGQVGCEDLVRTGNGGFICAGGEGSHGGGGSNVFGANPHGFFTSGGSGSKGGGCGGHFNVQTGPRGSCFR